MKIKVCFISLSAYKLFDQNSQVAFGGSELQLYLRAVEIAKDEHFDVYFLVNDHLGQNDFQEFDGVKVYRLKRYARNRWRGNFIKSIFNFFNALRKINADIYIQRAAGIETGMTTLFCKIFRKKFIYMTACQWDVSGEYAKKGLRGKIFLFGLKNADLIFTQNEEHKNLLKNNFGLESLVFKNVFPIDASITDSPKEHILWVSSSQELKRPELFLELAKRFSDEKFVMIMPQNDPKLFYFIQNEVKKIPNIIFIENVPFSKIDEYFAKAKIFINTSRFEGFPNTFIQSCVAKTPILSLIVNPDKFLDKYRCGFCANNDFNKMSEQLEILLQDQDLWQEASENAFRYVTQNHDIKKNIEIFKNALKELPKPQPQN